VRQGRPLHEFEHEGTDAISVFEAVSFTSRYKKMCGFVTRSLVTGPVNVIGSVGSNSARNEWCARTGVEARHNPTSQTSIARFIGPPHFAATGIPAPSASVSLRTNFSDTTSWKLLAIATRLPTAAGPEARNITVDDLFLL
jgi:hypothetical protein